MCGKIGKKRCFLLTDRTDRLYFSRVDIAEGALIVSDAEKIYFTDARYFSALKEKLSGSDTNARLLDDGALANFFKESDFSYIGLNYAKTTLKEYGEFKALRKKIFDCSAYIDELRSVKTETEREYIKKACEITQKAFYESLQFIKEGITEKEYREKLVSLYIKYGAEKESFDTIVAFGTGSAVPHHETGSTKLVKNAVVLIDTGCVYKGYCSYFTRTLFFGTPSEKFVRSYDAVYNANIIAEEKITAGTDVKAADGFSRDYLKACGLDKFFTHSLGHGVGLNIHEYPYLSPKRKGELKENNVFTVEPAVYFDGEFGIRIEDTVAIENGKTVRYFTDDKKLIIIK